MPKATPPFQRFLNRIKIDSHTGCWLWSGHKYRNGYGAIKAFGKMVLTHRFSYELHKGPIPTGMEILHSCDVKHCVNPEHLRAGNHSENMKEASERGLMKSGKDHPNFGQSRPGIKNRLSKPVFVMGKYYSSQKEAERCLGYASGSVRFWLKTGNPKARQVSREEYLKNA